MALSDAEHERTEETDGHEDGLISREREALLKLVLDASPKRKAELFDSAADLVIKFIEQEVEITNTVQDPEPQL